ncbi:MAG TPA: spermidine synthase [Spongiibacteraceae bacterium]|nr:spermidine synthase [Spongiibacteraceae bacterium]
MSIPGKEIYRTYDEYGPIQVFDDGTKRYLSFGEGDEQSCVLKAQPALLQHDYTRAMLLPLLYGNPRDVILAGLGGGALVNCLHHHLPELRVRVVELRHSIIKIAYRYFELPRDERIALFQQDISEFLEAEDIAKTDIFFSDIYGAEGMDPQFFQPWYIEACARLLNDDGWLVLNCWEEQRGDHDTLEAIADNFSEVYTCTVPSGNWIIMASKKASVLPENLLKERAKEQSKQFGYAVSENLYRLYHVHSRT